MQSISFYSAQKMLDLVLRGTAYTPPTSTYLSLNTTAATAAGGGTEVSGITRQPIAFNPASAGATANSNSVTFNSTEVGGATIEGWTIWDASSSGNLLAFHSFIPDVTIPGGEGALFPVGSITLTCDGVAMTDYLANKILDHLFNNTAYTPPADCYIGAYTATPTRTTTGTEVGDSAYGRQLFTAYVATASQTTNDTSIHWPPLLADADATLAGWAILDASTAGNVLWFGDWTDQFNPDVAATLDPKIGDVLTIRSDILAIGVH